MSAQDALLATVENLHREATFADGVSRAALYQGLYWRSIGRPGLVGASDETALAFAADARDMRATARDLRDGAW